MPERQGGTMPRGGNTKVAPPGYYTATEAYTRLGLNRSTFFYLVKTGKIPKYIPPLRSEGFYDKKDINRMAAEIALFFHTQEEETSIDTRVARPEDAQGIHAVLAEGFGWRTASVEQRLAWYTVNPLIDYIVMLNDEVVGYITAVPYRLRAMEDIMSGRRRAWDMTPDDIVSYTPVNHPSFQVAYDLYVGIAVRQDRPNPKWLAFRLISGWIGWLEEMLAKGIVIGRLYAVSAEPDGQRLCTSLGFMQLPAKTGDLFPRYMLDLETSSHHFARRYREALLS
jgi:hypothetical protein